MKHLLLLLALTIASTAFATDSKKDDKKTKCVPSKEVVCQETLKNKERPTPKKPKEVPVISTK